MFDETIDKSYFNPIEGFKCLKAQWGYRYFPYDGVVSFCGEQGSGKSLSAFRLMARLKYLYPDLTFVSNEDLSGFTDYVPFKDYTTIENLKKKSIVLFIDEICNMPNLTSLDSKTLPREWFALLNMQRKRELLIITTCPLFSRINKAFREQIDTVVICKKHGSLQHNRYCKIDYDKLLNAETSSDIMGGLNVVRHHWFFHSRLDYARFNTGALIQNGREVIL